MIWETLLSAALEAGLGVLAEAGFDDEARALKERLTKGTEKARRGAFDRAFQRAVEHAGEERLRPLLEHRPFQEAVVTGLLDSETGFDLQVAAVEWGEQPPVPAPALRRFFRALENTLLADDTWGPLLERFQDLRFRQDVVLALQERGAEASTVHLVSAVNAQLHGDVVTGVKRTDYDQHNQVIHGAQTNVVRATGPVLSGTFHIYQTPPGSPELSQSEFERILDDYLTWVWSEYRFARLHGLQALQGTGPQRKPLSAVYTSLRASRRPAVEPGGLRRVARRMWGKAPDEVPIPDEGAELVDMADLLTLGQRVAIVGGAGCGKTTYLAFVAATLAAALGGAELDVRLKPHRPGEVLPIPFLAPLRFWNVYRQEVAESPGERLHHPEAGSLKDFLLWYLRHSYKNFDAAGDFFERLLRGGGGLIMFDGLDEVVSREERLVVRDAITRLFDHSPYQGNLCLVTAREAGYRDAPFGSDFTRCDVQPMDEDQITALVDAWCAGISELRIARNRIVNTIGELNQERRERGQEPLVSTPLMVTMIVSVYYSKKELPRERARLYDAVTDVILQSQYSEADEVDARKLVVTWGGQMLPDKQREWLSLLAFLMHQAGDQGVVVDEVQVCELLTPPLQERGELHRLDAFVAQARDRGGLFEERGERFQFMHLTFQEYLAGQHLASQWRDEKERLSVWIVDDWWRETLLLTIGSLDHPRPYRERSDFVSHLLTLTAPAEAQMTAAELAITGLLDLSQPEEVLCRKARDRLVTLLTDPDLSVVSSYTRVYAGRTLSATGDPRPGVGVDPETDLSDILWRPIPGGILRMGSARGDEYAYDDEHGPDGQPVPVEIEPFYVAAYPVTVAQFRPFVEGDGYTNRAYWTPDGWKCKERESWTVPEYWDNPRWHLDNHPIVGVSWYEVVAYCRWLTHQVREAGCERLETLSKWGEVVDGIRHSSLVIRLPTEPEWEWIARGPDALRWPWGNEWQDGWCNSVESSISRTSAVGIFPKSAARWLVKRAAPVHDLAGNVCEWCATLWQDKYPLPKINEWDDHYLGGTAIRVLRGGAWSDVRGEARSASRGGYTPDNRDQFSGFRCCVASTSLSPAGS